MIYAIFGSLWLEVWVWLSHREQWWRYLLVACCGSALLGIAMQRYRRKPGAHSPPSANPQEHRVDLWIGFRSAPPGYD